jgi:hypothetical protein
LPALPALDQCHRQHQQPSRRAPRNERPADARASPTIRPGTISFRFGAAPPIAFVQDLVRPFAPVARPSCRAIALDRLSQAAGGARFRVGTGALPAWARRHQRRNQ